MYLEYQLENGDTCQERVCYPVRSEHHAAIANTCIACIIIFKQLPYCVVNAEAEQTLVWQRSIHM